MPKKDNVVRVPRPAAASFDMDRPLWRNQLLQTQVKHFYELEQTLPPPERTGISLDTITTEGEASSYIHRITSLLHPHTALKRPARKTARKRSRKAKVKKA